MRGLYFQFLSGFQYGKTEKMISAVGSTFNSFPDSRCQPTPEHPSRRRLSIPFRIPVEKRTLMLRLEDGKLSIPFRIPER